MMIPHCFHIGYHKTASTYLQGEVFQKLAGYFSFITPEQSYYDGREKLTVPNSVLAGDPEAPPGRKKLLFSDNRLTGTAYRDDLSFADMILATNKNAKIMVCIRSQFTVLRSYYFTCSKNGYAGSFEKFVHELAKNGKLQYFTMVSAYRERFGAGNVKVLFQEDLARDPERFLIGVLDFLGVTEQTAADFSIQRRRESPSDLVIDSWSLSSRIAAMCGLAPGPAKRAIDHVTVGLAFPASRLWKRIFKTPLNYRDYGRLAPLIESYWGDSNRRLFDLLGRSISDYRYPGAR